MPSGDGGLGTSLVGEKIMVNQRQVSVTKLLGEGRLLACLLVLPCPVEMRERACANE